MSAATPSDQLVRRMLGTVRESVLLTDADLEDGPHILYVNEAFCRMTGYTSAEVIGRTPRLLQGPETDRSLLRRLKSDLVSGRAFEGETTNYKRGGEPFRIAWYIEPVLGSSGDAEFYLAVQRDVTVRHQREAMLRSTMRALDASPSGLLFVDASGLVVRSNPAARTLLELDEAHLRQRPLVAALEDAGVVTREEDSFVVLVPSEDMQPERRLELQRIGNDSGDTIWMITDMTERRRLDALANAVNVVEQTGYVFAGIRHELGNPINSIKTAVTVLEKHHDRFDGERRIEYYRRILAELERVEFLLQSLKSYNAVESMRLGRFELASQVSSFMRVAQAELPINVRLEWSPPPEPCHVVGDPRGLYQVLLNLFKNALDAVSGRDAGCIRFKVNRTGAVAQLEVVDNGRGMSPRELAAVGRPFATSKPHGTGLGVCVSQRILTRMNGTLEYDSTLGAGTTCLVMLPVAAA